MVYIEIQKKVALENQKDASTLYGQALPDAHR